MGNIISKNGTTYFAPELVTEMFNLVKGHSTIARLANQTPIPFTGSEIMTFSMDHEVSIVGENAAKVNGGGTLGSISILPIKFEYGLRVSDEFMYASEERQLTFLQAFMEGFSRKLGRGIDIASFHGFNPYSGTASSVVGTNHFDSAITAGNTVTFAAATADDNLESAIQKVTDAENEVTGIAMAPAFAAAMAALKTDDKYSRYPEFKFGGKPATFAGMDCDINPTVAFNSNNDRVIVGDFQNAFKWGYSKEIPLKVIEYGCPDNDATAGDLQGHNQVYLRSEAYVGWGILDAAAFAKVAASNG
ncbi:MAG: phage major capsid protein [Parasporobacterium sp.]|nr:phage major capsid protein [Parasporobacterium sp.]